jgi:hypothetical protein
VQANTETTITSTIWGNQTRGFSFDVFSGLDLGPVFDPARRGESLAHQQQRRSAFNQPPGDTYALSDRSPAIKNGDDSAVLDPHQLDLIGRSRVFGRRVDLGAYEHVYADGDGDEVPDGCNCADIDGCECHSDLDGSSFVDLEDLLIRLINYGRAPVKQNEDDVEGDGAVDRDDLRLLLANLQLACE